MGFLSKLINSSFPTLSRVTDHKIQQTKTDLYQAAAKQGRAYIKFRKVQYDVEHGLEDILDTHKIELHDNLANVRAECEANVDRRKVTLAKAKQKALEAEAELEATIARLGKESSANSQTPSSIHMVKDFPSRRPIRVVNWFNQTAIHRDSCFYFKQLSALNSQAINEDRSASERRYRNLSIANTPPSSLAVEVVGTVHRHYPMFSTKQARVKSLLTVKNTFAGQGGRPLTAD